MHEIDPTYGGASIDPRQTADVARWRQAERKRLIAVRLSLSADDRAMHGEKICRQLDDIVPRTFETIISVYWPFRGEPDLRTWMAGHCSTGVRMALPVVVGKNQPLLFREWSPGTRLKRGVWNIPYPADGEAVVPTVVIAPLVGFDTAGFRLGYGGGFFDRAFAAFEQRPHVIGVGHSVCEVSTIYPQPHDIPMTTILTGCEPPRTYSKIMEGG